MVKWSVQVNGFSLDVEPGKLVLACPCQLNYQKELLFDLQKKKSQFRVFDSEAKLVKGESPILIARSLANLSGQELCERWSWWLEESRYILNGEDPLSQLVPKSPQQWEELRLEKRIALFMGLIMRTHSWAYLFLGELHLEPNAQNLLFNSLKNSATLTGHTSVVLWSYRLTLPQTIPLFFKGFGENAA